MQRLSTHLLIIGLMLLASPATGVEIEAPAQDVTLNTHIVVDDNVVRLGDMFRNVGDQAEVAVAYAPEPGQQSLLDARWLYRVARAYKLDWQPLGSKIHAVVERASVTVPYDEVKTQILAALAQRGLDGDADIEFSSRFAEIHLPAGSHPTVDIESIDYFERTGRFTVVIGGPGVASSARMRLTGRAFRTIDVPVLSTRVLRGDIIRDADVEYIRMNADRVQRDVIVDASELVGMTPKRGMRAGQPVRGIDISRPLLVPKNSLVMIVHRVHNMTLTAQGKALEAGADGDVIQIKNAQSNQVIEAEVIGPGRVAVKTLSQQLSMTLN